MMALKDLLTIEPKPESKGWLAKMEKQLDAEDYEWLLSCLKNEQDYSAHYLARKLTQLGYPVSNSTISKIRKDF
jgi:hypothetical protein